MKTTRLLLPVLLGTAAAVTVAERDARAGTSVSRTDTFCLDAGHPGVILRNDLASLEWTPLGDLVLTNKGSYRRSTQMWGLWASGLATSFTPDLQARVCLESDGNLRIRKGTGAVAWESSPTGIPGNHRLTLNQCSLKTQVQTSTGWTKTWGEATDECSLTSTGNAGGAGWCQARPTADTRILWDDAAQTQLVWQPDGNLVLYAADGSAPWASGTYGTGEDLCFQADGNLVVYDAGGAALYAPNTYGKGVDKLALDACGVSLSAPMSGVAARKELWRQGSPICDQRVISTGWCRTTDAAGRILASDDAHLDWQADGNLVVYDTSGRARWSSGTYGAARLLCFQTDGNLVAYRNPDATTPLWSSGTYGHPGVTLELDAYTLSIADPAHGNTLWSRTPSDALEALGNGAFSFVSEERFGDSRFGAGLWIVAAGADADSINKLRARGNASARVGHVDEMYLPSGTVASSFAEVLGDAGVSATMFSRTETVMELSGYVGNAGGQSNHVDLAVFGRSALSGTVGLDFSAPTTNATFFEAEATFTLGFIPVTMHGEISGSVGADAQLVPGSSGVDIRVSPFATITASGSVSTGIACASAGIEGELTLIDVRVPLDLDLSFTSTPRTYSLSGDLEISTLDGSIDLYADACGYKRSKDLASWNGVSSTANLFDQSGNL